MTPIEFSQLHRLERGEDIKSSDRDEDRARTALKKRGFIRFDRVDWRWRITDAGRAALKQAVGT